MQGQGNANPCNVFFFGGLGGCIPFHRPRREIAKTKEKHNKIYFSANVMDPYRCIWIPAVLKRTGSETLSLTLLKC